MNDALPPAPPVSAPSPPAPNRYSFSSSQSPVQQSISGVAGVDTPFNLLHTGSVRARMSLPGAAIGTNSLERALQLLEMVEKPPGGLRNAEISRRLRIPKSTCSWILARLERRGYLMRDDNTNRYKLGLKAVALAHGALRELGFRSSAEPVLYRIASETGLAAGIGVLEGNHVLIVDRVEAPESPGARHSIHARPRDQREIGRELPAHSTALGKVLLA